MSVEQVSQYKPAIQRALAELKETIAKKYPEAAFSVSRGEDEEEGLYLTATVDVDDTDEVMDLLVDRLLAMQVEEGLPIYVVPIRPLERAREDLAS